MIATADADRARRIERQLSNDLYAPGDWTIRIGDREEDSTTHEVRLEEHALEQTDLSPRELAVRFTDEKRYFVSEATVYRLLKAHDLITSPAYTVIKAAEKFHT